MITQSIEKHWIQELSIIKSLKIDDFTKQEIKGSKQEIKGSKQEMFIEKGFVSINDIERYTETILEKQKEGFL